MKCHGLLILGFAVFRFSRHMERSASVGRQWEGSQGFDVVFFIHKGKGESIEGVPEDWGGGLGWVTPVKVGIGGAKERG